MARQPRQNDETTTMRDVAEKEIEERREAAEHAPMDRAGSASNQGREVTTTDQNHGALSGVPGLNFKVKKLVSIPVLSWPDGATLVFKVETPIHEGKEVSDGARGPIQKKADLMIVSAILINEGGKTYSVKKRTLVVGEVLKGEFEGTYPDQSYVGCWFHVVKYAPNAAKQKRYATYGITEIENPAEGIVYDELG